MSDPIHQLWLYTHWANQRILASLQENEQSIPESCLRLFSHIVNAQLIWLSRINGDPQPVGVWTEHSLAECEKLNKLFSDAIEQGIADNQKERTKNITYTTSTGVVFTTLLQDILLHTFNHGTYHRAQIAQEMKRAGLEPPNTDYILYKR